MPDVGVLNLQIHDDSAKAAEGLSKLVAKLGEMKNATRGIRLNSVAIEIGKLAKAVNDEISGSTIAKLNELADVLQRISSASGNVGGIRISFGGRGQSAEDMATQLQAARDTVAQTTAGFEQIGQRVQEDVQGAESFANTMGRVNEIVQQTGWTAQATAEQFAQMFQVMNSMRMGMALGSGTAGLLGEGFIHGEGSVSDAVEPLRLIAGETERVVDSINEANAAKEEFARPDGWGTGNIENIIASTTRLGESLRGMHGILEFWQSVHSVSNATGLPINNILQQIRDVKERAKEARASIKEMLDTLNKGTPKNINWAQSIDRMQGIGAESKSAAESASVFARELESGTSDLARQMQELTPLIGDADAGTKRLSDRIKELTFGAEGANGAFKRMFPTLSGLLGRFSQLVKYRMLRAVIKQIAEGFREGTENYYRYSQAIGGEFATKMDNAATALLQMKNSIGAAAAPLINSLIPYLQMAVDWFINIVNYANQFVALLRGQATWSRAVPKTTKAFEDQTKAAKKAGSAVKDLLADWDELNIIQSESGGGGGGAVTSAAEDYLNMFEEVGEYEDWISDLVDGIKDQFGDVWGLVKKIGLALLGWKFSSAFTGWLGLLGSLGLIDLEFNISAMLNNKYFDTGEIGWLVADVLQALVGGVLMRKLLSKVLAGQYAYLGIPIMLTVNASARVLTMLGRADVSALSEEGLISNVVSALETAGVAGYLAYTAGATLGQSLAGGAVAAILTFSALTGLKADVDAVRNGEITEDTIKAKALSALGLSIGAAAAAKLLVPGVSAAQSIGFGLVSGAAATLVTMSATLGIIATTEAVKSGITEDVILKDLASSLAMAVGSAFIIKMVTATSWKISAASGGGVGLVTLGALIGIQATCEAVKNDAITADTVIKDATASLLLGGGIALVAGMLVGVGAGTALTVGGLTALTTFGALIGIQAVLQSVKKDKIKWGSEVLTRQEVQAFVDEKVFDVKLPVAIQLVQSKIEDSRKAGEELENKTGEIMPIINTLLLGFDIEGSLAELDKEIFGTDGLIEKYNHNGESKKAEIEAALVLVPIKDNEGNDMSADYLKSINQGWSNIDTIMTDLGKSLSSTMRDSYTGQLKKDLTDMERTSIAEITETMLNIAATMSSSQAEVQMKKDFAKGLSELSGQSIQDIINYYTEQRDASREKMNDAFSVYMDDLAAQQLTNEKLLAKAQANGGEYAGKSVEYYQGEIDRIKKLYAGLTELRDSSIKSAMKFYTTGSGLDMIRSAIIDAVSASDIKWKTRNTGNQNFLFSTIIEDLFKNSDLNDESNKKHLTALMQGYLQEVISNSIENPEPILNALQLGLIGYGDLFNLADFMPEFEKNYGKSDEDRQKVEVIKTLLSDLFSNNPYVAKEANDAAAQVNDEIQDAFANTEPIQAGGEIELTETYNVETEYVEPTMATEENPIISEAQEMAGSVQSAADTVNSITLDQLDFDTTGAVTAANDAAWAIEDMASRIRAAFESLNGMSFTFSAGDQVLSGIISTVIPTIEQRASGGFVRSGDLVMANENGNFEMMGRMGNQPVVANNQQIVNGISQGVANANGGVESRLGTIETLLTRILNKEFTAKAVPGSAWGGFNSRSNREYEKVTG